MEIIWKLFPNPSFTVSLPNVPHPVWRAVDPHCSEEFKLLANFYLLPDPEDHQGHSSSFTNLVVLLFHFCYLEMIILWMNPETSLNLKKKKVFVIGVLGEDVEIQSIAHNTILTIFLCLSGCEELCGLATFFGFTQ